MIPTTFFLGWDRKPDGSGDGCFFYDPERPRNKWEGLKKCPFWQGSLRVLGSLRVAARAYRASGAELPAHAELPAQTDIWYSDFVVVMVMWVR